MLEQVASLNLEILNTSGFLPTYMGPTGYGDIDVSLYRGSCNLLQRLSWRVLDWSTSDHRPIEISASLARPLAVARDERLKLSRAKWSYFRRCWDCDM